MIGSHATQLRQRTTSRRINAIIIHHPIRQMVIDMTNKLPLARTRRIHLQCEHIPIVQTLARNILPIVDEVVAVQMEDVRSHAEGVDVPDHRVVETHLEHLVVGVAEAVEGVKSWRLGAAEHGCGHVGDLRVPDGVVSVAQVERRHRRAAAAARRILASPFLGILHGQEAHGFVKILIEEDEFSMRCDRLVHLAARIDDHRSDKTRVEIVGHGDVGMICPELDNVRLRRRTGLRHNPLVKKAASWGYGASNSGRRFTSWRCRIGVQTALVVFVVREAHRVHRDIVA